MSHNTSFCLIEVVTSAGLTIVINHASLHSPLIKH